MFVSHGIEDAVTPIEFARESQSLAQRNMPTLMMEYNVRPTLCYERRLDVPSHLDLSHTHLAWALTYRRRIVDRSSLADTASTVSGLSLPGCLRNWTTRGM